MTAASEAPERPDPPVPHGPGPTSWRRWRVVLGVAAVGVLVWVVGLVRFRSWRANDDLAITQLTIERFADGEVPLLGAYSRFGFFHPGPLREWTFGALYWLSGTRAAALPSAALVANLAMVALALVAARRSYGARGIVAAGTVLVVLQLGLGSWLHSAWNPYLAVLAGAATGWGVVATLTDGSRNWWLVVVPGSFLAQLHVSGTVALALGLAVVAVVTVRAREPVRLAAAAGTTLVLWIGPLLDLTRGSDSNLAAFLDRTGGDAVGLADAVRTVTRLMTPWSLAGGDVTGSEVPLAGPIGALVAVAAFVAATVVLARDPRRRVLPAVAVVAAFVAVLVGSQLVTPAFGYLWAPWLGLTSLWLSTVVLAATDAVVDRFAVPRPRHAGAVAAAVTIAVSVVGWWSLTDIETAGLQRTIEAAVPAVVDEGEAYRIRSGGLVGSLAHAEVALAVQQAGGRPTSHRFELGLPEPAVTSPTLVVAMQEPLDCLAATLEPAALVLRHPSTATGLDVGVFLVDPVAARRLDDCGIAP